MIISTDPLSGPLEDEAEDVSEGGASHELRELTVPAPLHGERLDRVLAGMIPEFSRSYLQQLVEAGHARVNGDVAGKPSQRVRVADRLGIDLLPTPQTQAFRPQPMDLAVVYEDADVLVIDKPAGLVVHPAPGHWSGTLLNGLLARDARAAALPRAGIVHRLDKDTSGLMVVARSRQAMDALVRAIAAREVRRQYLALAHGQWHGSATRDVDAPVGRDPRNRLRMAIVDLDKNSGKPASTGFLLLQKCEHGCLVECTLRTGRTHQIRVHLASIGHPLVADALYGGANAAGLTRQALHAAKLAFVHPVTGESLSFQAPLPPDMRAALAAWGLGYNGLT